MRNEYYGSSRASQDFLAHYGVKGMKWGVRKAIEKGNSKKLHRQYLKASKKLEKLNQRTNIDKQKELSERYGKAAKVSRKIGLTGAQLGLAGIGTNHTLRLITGLRKHITTNKIADLDRKSSNILKTFDDEWLYYTGNNGARAKEKGEEWTRRWGEDIKRRHGEAQNRVGREVQKEVDSYNATANRNKTIAEIGNKVGRVGLGVGAAGLGVYAVTKAKSVVAKKRSTPEGHKKAIAKRNEWKNQMQEAFKGTKYEKLPKYDQPRSDVRNKIVSIGKRAAKKYKK